MKCIYTVYNRTFTNKKDALAYHNKIYGHCNYQASIVTVYDALGRYVGWKTLSNNSELKR